MEELILGELTERKIGYGIVQPGESTIGGVPVIKVNNIISGLKSILDLDTTHPENDQKYRKTRLNGGEIIISVVGTIGKTVIVPMDFKGCNLVRATALIDIKDPILSRWVKYYIDSPKGQSYINGNLNTTVQPTLNIKSLVEMPIPFYGREYAEKVVTILSKIDDKIENNRRINDNLEQQARALYKSWFIDFEPFKNGKFIDSELGKIPEGWRVGELSEITNITSGKRPTTKSDYPTSIDKVPVFGASGIMAYTTDKLYDIPILIIGRVGTLGIVQKIDAESWPSDNTLVILSKNYHFVYFNLKSIDYQAINRGSTQPLITQSDIKQQMILIPQDEVLMKFEENVNILDKAIKNNNKAIKNLEILRDTLLPKLMSGELKINEIDC